MINAPRPRVASAEMQRKWASLANLSFPHAPHDNFEEERAVEWLKTFSDSAPHVFTSLSANDTSPSSDVLNRRLYYAIQQLVKKSIELEHLAQIKEKEEESEYEYDEDDKEYEQLEEKMKEEKRLRESNLRKLATFRALSTCLTTAYLHEGVYRASLKRIKYLKLINKTAREYVGVIISSANSKQLSSVIVDSYVNIGFERIKYELEKELLHSVYVNERGLERVDTALDCKLDEKLIKIKNDELNASNQTKLLFSTDLFGYLDESPSSLESADCNNTEPRKLLVFDVDEVNKAKIPHYLTKNSPNPKTKCVSKSVDPLRNRLTSSPVCNKEITSSNKLTNEYFEYSLQTRPVSRSPEKDIYLAKGHVEYAIRSRTLSSPTIEKGKRSLQGTSLASSNNSKSNEELASSLLSKSVDSSESSSVKTKIMYDPFFLVPNSETAYKRDYLKETIEKSWVSIVPLTVDDHTLPHEDASKHNNQNAPNADEFIDIKVNSNMEQLPHFADLNLINSNTAVNSSKLISPLKTLNKKEIKSDIQDSTDKLDNQGEGTIGTAKVVSKTLYNELLDNFWKNPIVISVTATDRTYQKEENEMNRLQRYDPEGLLLAASSDKFPDLLIIKVFDLVLSTGSNVKVNLKEYTSFLYELRDNYGDEVLVHFQPGNPRWWVKHVLKIIKIVQRPSGDIVLRLNKKLIEKVVLYEMKVASEINASQAISVGSNSSVLAATNASRSFSGPSVSKSMSMSMSNSSLEHNSSKSLKNKLSELGGGSKLRPASPYSVPILWHSEIKTSSKKALDFKGPRDKRQQKSVTSLTSTAAGAGLSNPGGDSISEPSALTSSFKPIKDSCKKVIWTPENEESPEGYVDVTERVSRDIIRRAREAVSGSWAFRNRSLTASEKVFFSSPYAKFEVIDDGVEEEV